MYRVFLVEDEIVTREGIRDRIPWQSLGFTFCGEASDGEMALPLIEAARPEVVITDIKMPFMDGLQLARLVRQRLPQTRIIILSGHDEFTYAQQAIQAGVCEYLLKPFSAADLEQVLRRVAGLIRQDEAVRQQVETLQRQAADTLDLRRQNFLRRLAVGDLPPAQALEDAQALELNIVAACYQVMVVRVESQCPPEQPYALRLLSRAEQIIAAFVQDAQDVLLFPKDLEESVLLLKGARPEDLERAARQLVGMIEDALHSQAACQVRTGAGPLVARLSEIPASFAAALSAVETPFARSDMPPANQEPHDIASLRVDRTATNRYLRTGSKNDFESFFAQAIYPLAGTAFEGRIFFNYVLVDLALSAAGFVAELGGDPNLLLPETQRIDRLLAETRTLDDLRQAAERLLLPAIAFRDQQAGRSNAALIDKVRRFIAERFADPELSLQQAAAQANLSPSHFSLVFSREMGETFIDYLTRLRLERAMELLRSSDLKTYEIAGRVGYNDPHYFSAVFKKHTGLTPTDFRRS